MSRVYRTANGGKVDLGALLLSQENTRSVGNMGVNARGDKIDSHNEVIETRNEPTWLPPQPFLNLGVKTRLIYERLRASKDI